uniref:Very-long-chain (3R)-3-hydroxyacyl-CoA dehydratase n=1 Tax=Panagrellus redivivus TaxID=6233 RepID=A0A7E4VA62_PANRE
MAALILNLQHHQDRVVVCQTMGLLSAKYGVFPIILLKNYIENAFSTLWLFTFIPLTQFTVFTYYLSKVQRRVLKDI